MRRSVKTIAVAGLLDFVSGLAFAVTEHVSIPIGLYWAVTTATTVGYGDVTPHTTVGHVIAVVVMLTVIPLFAATFSLLTSSLTVEHVRSEGHEMRRRLDHIIRNHPQIPELGQSRREIEDDH
jgi:voltage-gated potassium channel